MISRTCPLTASLPPSLGSKVLSTPPSVYVVMSLFFYPILRAANFFFYMDSLLGHQLVVALHELPSPSHPQPRSKLLLHIPRGPCGPGVTALIPSF